MIQNRQQKYKHENLKTQTSINPKSTQLQFGKLIKLPYIRKIVTNNHTNNINASKRSPDSKQTKKYKLSHSRDEEYLGQTQLNLLTLQEIQLCNQKTRYMQGFPKINGSNQVLFHREKSIESLQRQHKLKTQKSLSKVDTAEYLKQYKLGNVLGRGTYSVVRACRNRQGKKLAIKTYLKSCLNQDRYINLQSELSILKLIKNQYLLQLIQVIQTQQSINIITDHFDNKSLSDWLKHDNLSYINDQIARIIMKQLIKALVYMHGLDIVHRDLKIDNILINKDYKIKLIDYGFSKQLPRQNYILQDFCGTPHYIAPQVIQRQGYLGKPADIWSLGIILYKVVVGNFPFKGQNQKNLFNKVMKGDIKYPNDLSSDLKSLLERMLTYDYRKRPTAQQLLNDQWLNT